MSPFYLFTDGHRNNLGEFDGNGVPELTHRLRPRPMEAEIVWKRLQAGTLAFRKVSHRTVGAAKHVLATGHPVDTGFERLRWLI